jgi:hypothetical protein
MRVLLGLAALAVVACGDDETSGGAGGGEGGVSGALTLDNCATSFGEGVPAFYEKYFRCVLATVEGDTVILRSDALPPHPSHYYDPASPNHVAFDDQDGTRFKNPNEIAAQDLAVGIPASPVAKGLTIDAAMIDGQPGHPEEYDAMGWIGVGLDGVAFFHGTAAPGDSLEQEQFSFDPYEGHPQMTGIYHHHGPTPASLAVLARAGLTASTEPGAADVELYGMFCDGTLVLGCRELDGAMADAADFDAQNGHVHDVVDDEGTTHFAARYHTHVCDALGGHLFTPEIQYHETCASP